MDTRIGYPNEHLAGNSDPEITSPLYATAVGLVMNNLQDMKDAEAKLTENMVSQTTPKETVTVKENKGTESIEETIVEETTARQKADEEAAKRATISKKWSFSNWAEKFKEFLDNAE